MSDQYPVGALDIPEEIYACRVGDIYRVRLIPADKYRLDGIRYSGFRAEISWKSDRSGLRECFQVTYGASATSQKDFSINRLFKRDLTFSPYPMDSETNTEYRAAWEACKIDDLIRTQMLPIGQYIVLASLASWRRAQSAYHLPRQQECIEDMWEFAEEAITALVTQFPDEAIPFPIPRPEPVASFGMR